MKNGTELIGLATLPENPSPVPILFKENDKAKSQKINCDDIKTLQYLIIADKTMEFDRMDVYLNSGSKKPEKLRLLVSRRGGITLYLYYGLDMSGGFKTSLYEFLQYWLCYRQGEEAETSISTSGSKNKKDVFTQMALAYFKDDPELIKKLQSNFYKWNEMEQEVDDYNAWKKNNYRIIVVGHHMLAQGLFSLCLTPLPASMDKRHVTAFRWLGWLIIFYRVFPALIFTAFPELYIRL